MQFDRLKTREFITLLGGAAAAWPFGARNSLVVPAEATMRTLITSLSLFIFTETVAIAMDREELKNVRPEIRQWFEQLKSPAGEPCCSYADGHRTEYDIRQGQYWIPIAGEWFPVPEEAMIYDANPIGDAIVWYMPQYADEKPGLVLDVIWKIFCFVPPGSV